MEDIGGSARERANLSQSLSGEYSTELFIHLYTPCFHSDIDVNGRYIYNHSLAEELKATLSKVITILSSAESEDFKSSILILRIATPPQPCLSLAQTVSNILLRITGPKGRERPSIRSSFDTRQMESKMKSARGVEYSKPTTLTTKPELTVSIDNPGVEFNQRVFPL